MLSVQISRVVGQLEQQMNRLECIVSACNMDSITRTWLLDPLTIFRSDYMPFFLDFTLTRFGGTDHKATHPSFVSCHLQPSLLPILPSLHAGPAGELTSKNHLLQLAFNPIGQ